MISKAHCFSLRLSLCRLIYLWRSEADIGPEIKISTWETSRFETSLLPDTLHTPREAHKCPYGIPCLQAAKQSSVFLHVCVCVYIFIFFFFFLCMYVCLRLLRCGQLSFQAVTTRIRSSAATWLQRPSFLHVSLREKQVLFQPLIQTLSELPMLHSPCHSSILTKILPRKGSKDQLTLDIRLWRNIIKVQH